MMRRTQLIAAVIATACAGVGSAMACGTCGGYGGGYGYYSRPAPVGEFLTTRTFIRERPICYTRTVRTYVQPAPVGEWITTRRVFVRRLAPVADMLPMRTRCYTRLAPVGERIITRRVIAERPYGFTRTVAAPVRWTGSVVSWPFRRAFCPQPEIVGERILVTKVSTYPSERACVTKRHYKKVLHAKMVHPRRHHVAFTKRIAPVGERAVIIRRHR